MDLGHIPRPQNDSESVMGVLGSWALLHAVSIASDGIATDEWAGGHPWGFIGQVYGL